MGYGDEIMGSGLARGAAARGKRIAFGDGTKIYWSWQAREIYQNNPNVAPPGQERATDLEWIRHWTSHRLYAQPTPGRWKWSATFRATPGEIFFSPAELEQAEQIAPGFVLIEPAVKHSAVNKQWPRERYAAVARALIARGYTVSQFAFSGAPLDHRVEVLPAVPFRLALAYLAKAALYIGPEGGLHHGAAALGVPAVVIFGGFIPPRLTGYDLHTNLAGPGEACGVYGRVCRHCQQAMASITAERVVEAALDRLEGGLLQRA